MLVPHIRAFAPVASSMRPTSVLQSLRACGSSTPARNAATLCFVFLVFNSATGVLLSLPLHRDVPHETPVGQIDERTLDRVPAHHEAPQNVHALVPKLGRPGAPPRVPPTIELAHGKDLAVDDLAGIQRDNAFLARLPAELVDYDLI